MTTAHNFPDLSLSPIHPDDDDRQEFPHKLLLAEKSMSFNSRQKEDSLLTLPAEFENCHLSLSEQNHSSAVNAQISKADFGKRTKCSSLDLFETPKGRNSSGPLLESTGSSNQRFQNGELTFDRPLNATQLLLEIEKLTKRLDKCARRINAEHSEKHSRRTCEVSIRKEVPEAPCLQCLKAVTVSRPILRRRTHVAFSLEHRAPYSESVSLMKQHREEDTATGRLDNQLLRDNKGSVNNTEVVKKILENDNNPISLSGRVLIRTKFNKKNDLRECYERNSFISEDSGGNLNGAVDENVDPRLETPMQCGSRLPLIKTASSLINRLQCVPSSDEFVRPKSSRVSKFKDKRGIVLTGFPKSEKKTYQRYAYSLSLIIQSGVERNTLCVVSGNGLRTLNTLRAVVSGVPVVNREWIKSCKRENRLISSEMFEFDQWKWIIEKRKMERHIFSRLGRVMVLCNVTPSADDIRWMIKKSGGKLSSNVSNCSLIVAPSGLSVDIPWVQRSLPPPPVVNEMYILDCITKNELLLYDNYIEHYI